ncbi:MAG: hypothetical protein K9J82_07570 [Methylotenera sp.]|jgi:chromosome segregation ATPase|nr:hypothetical protein [Methylotenera sp.]
MRRLAMLPLSALLLSALLVSGAHAQDGKPSREREALRRAQAALRSAQEQQTSLSAEKAKAEAAAASSRQEAASARAQIASTAARLKARDAEIEALRSQLQAAQGAQRDADARASEREQNLQRQLLAARQDGSALQQANQALVQLLERSTQALAETEGKNHQLYALGQQLVQRLSQRSPLEQALQQDPVLGLTAVRLEDQAEALRAELAARRLVRPGTDAR